jgi:putative transposase
MKLNLPRRTKRRLPQRVQQPMVVEARANAEWSMDFMSDTLYHGRRFRTLNILDEGVREVLDIVIDTSIPGGRVVRTLDRLVEWRGKPDAIRVDNVLPMDVNPQGSNRSPLRVITHIFQGSQRSPMLAVSA